MIAKLKPRPFVERRHFLKEWRDLKELTQEELANKIADNLNKETIGHHVISKLETNTVKLGEKYLYPIAEALGIEPSWIFRRPEEVLREVTLLRKLSGMDWEEIDAILEAAHRFRELAKR